MGVAHKLYNCCLALIIYILLFIRNLIYSKSFRELARAKSYFFPQSLPRFHRWICSTKEITISRERYNVLLPVVARFIIRSEHRTKYSRFFCTAHVAPCKQPLVQLRDGLAATPVLFELTSSSVMREKCENRCGYTSHPTSYTNGAYLDLYPLLFTSPRRYTGAHLLRRANPTKFAGATSFAELEWRAG